MDTDQERQAEARSDVVAGALMFPFIANMPMKIDHAVVRAGLLGGHELGLAVSAQAGDASYRRRLHPD